MNWVQSNDSYQHTCDEPPTPIKTPTSATYDESLFQTPKIESSFYEPALNWLSPDSNASTGKQFQTPAKGGRAKRVNISHSSFSKQEFDTQLASHVNHFSPNPLLALPPVEPSRQLSSSRNPATASAQSSHIPTNDTFKSERQAGSTESTRSIQTPPPTRVSRKQPSRLLGRRLSASAMADPGRNSNARVSNMGPPETPSRMMQASPHLFPALQFSPDLFQPQSSGPATAPAYPQQRLFWDSNSANTNINTMTGHYQDSFEATHNGLVSPFMPSPVMSHGFENANLLPETAYDLPSSQVSQSTVSASPYYDSSGFPAPFTASPRAPLPVAEDPSLFLSSPARRFGPPGQSFGTTNMTFRAERQPYHHQIEESKREEEFERSKKTKIQHPLNNLPSLSTTRRPASPNVETKSGLKRSSTHSGLGDRRNARLSQQSQLSAGEAASVGIGEQSRHSRGGRSSPLKRVSRDSWQSLSERPSSRQRTSLTFTIDKDGRAKTLVTTVPEASDSHMDLGEDSSDSETDSIDVADFNIARSQNNSFSFPEQGTSHQSFAKPRAGIQSHSKNSSLSSTMTSSNSTYHSSRTSSNFGSSRPRSKRTDNPHIRTGHSHVTQPRQNSLQASHADKSFLDDASDDERGDAQHALRAVLKDRPRATSFQTGFTKRQSGPPPPQFHSSPPTHENTYGGYNASPTTITDPDLATPSTDHGSYSSNNTTRCVCNSSSPDGQYMIQCESCSKWLHTHCVGVDARQIPAVYICVYCAQTPMRHGRIREPSRAAALAPASPLAHKSNRYR